VAALAQELARQVRLRRLEQLVDPVVDLAEELGTLDWTQRLEHAPPGERKEAEAFRLTDVLRGGTATVRVAEKEEERWD
jgi:hypothetical protein